jgi:hypothetical protein
MPHFKNAQRVSILAETNLHHIVSCAAGYFASPLLDIMPLNTRTLWRPNRTRCRTETDAEGLCDAMADSCPRDFSELKTRSRCGHAASHTRLPPPLQTSA